MHRYVMILPLLFVCGGALACQSYTSTLEKSEPRANETAAIAALHSISLAEQSYSAGNGSYGTFEQLVQAGSLDQRFKSEQPTLSGYVLTLTVTPKSETAPQGSYTINADPKGTTVAGARHLYFDSVSGLIRVNATQPAGASDQTLQ